MKILSYMIAAVVLTACQPVVDRGVYLAQETKGSFWAAVDAFEGALQYEPEPQNQPAEERYCYRARYDIVCYDEPRLEPTIGALEGAQNPIHAPEWHLNGNSFYDMASAPPPYEPEYAPAGEAIQVGETAPIAEPAAYDPAAPEPIGGF